MKTLILIVMTMALTMVASHTALTIKSPVFINNDFIPSKYSCEGSNINPSFTIDNLPNGTKSMALIMDDPDAESRTFDHWIIWNIPPKGKIEENSAPGVQGRNGKNENSYTGPCPPTGTHHYHFKVYALDTKLDLQKNADKLSLLAAMEGHVLAMGELIGLYKK